MRNFMRLPDTLEPPAQHVITPGTSPAHMLEHAPNGAALRGVIHVGGPVAGDHGKRPHSLHKVNHL